MSERTCTLPDCEKKYEARGWCQMHYVRWKKHGDPLWERPKAPETCEKLNCEGATLARGLCRKHYSAWQRNDRGEEALEASRAYQREYKRAEYHRDVEKARQKTIAWRRNNIERSRLIDARKHAKRKALGYGVLHIDFSADQLAARLASWGNRCWLCNGEDAVAIDHVKPMFKGGINALCNIRPICNSCNSGKHDTWPFDTSRRR